MRISFQSKGFGSKHQDFYINKNKSFFENHIGINHQRGYYRHHGYYCYDVLTQIRDILYGYTI